MVLSIFLDRKILQRLLCDKGRLRPINATIQIPFEQSFVALFHDELSKMIASFMEPTAHPRKRYLTMEETAERTGIGIYVLRRLTRERAMPHRLIRKRIVFDESEIEFTIEQYKALAWEDPDKDWDVDRVRMEIEDIRKKKEEPLLIEDILRKLIKEELAQFSADILHQTKKEQRYYYGRTNLTIREAAEHFRVSPSTIQTLIKEDGMPHYKIGRQYYIVLEEAESFLWRETAKENADTGNIYWTRILEQLDWEERNRKAEYEKALKRIHEMV